MKKSKVIITSMIIMMFTACATNKAKHLSSDDLYAAISNSTTNSRRWGNLYFSPDGRILGDIYKFGDKRIIKADLFTASSVAKNIQFRYGEGKYHINSNGVLEILWPVDGSSSVVSTVYFKMHRIADEEYLPCWKEDVSECDRTVIWKFTKGDVYDYSD